MKPLLHEFLIDTPSWKVYTSNELTMQGTNLFGWRKQKALFDVRLHHHPNLFEFHLFQDGTYTFDVENKIHTVNGGNVFVTLPGELHKGSFAISGGHQFYWFQLQASESFLGLSPEKTNRLLEKLYQIKHRSIPFTTTMEVAICEAFNHSCSHDLYDQQVAENQLVSFLYQLLKQDNTMDSSEESPKNSSEIRQAINYMQEHVHQPIEIPTVASLMGMSESFFRTKFKKEIGISPAGFFTNLRISRAKQLLQQGHSVTETAMMMEFSTPNYFSTVFHRVTNMTPTEYINQQKDS